MKIVLTPTNDPERYNMRVYAYLPYALNPDIPIILEELTQEQSRKWDERIKQIQAQEVDYIGMEAFQHRGDWIIQEKYYGKIREAIKSLGEPPYNGP